MVLTWVGAGSRGNRLWRGKSEVLDDERRGVFITISTRAESANVILIAHS